MDFEFNPQKYRINEQKHRIDFIEAQLLWEVADRIEIPVPNT